MLKPEMLNNGYEIEGFKGSQFDKGFIGAIVRTFGGFFKAFARR